jgi:predicted Rossmann fold nucleotide-binding protein DprA/Smf involved in DNA uptake
MPGEREVVLMACSSLAAPRDTDAAPFGPKVWRGIAGRAKAAGLGLAELPELDAPVLTARLGLKPADGDRLHRLLQRGTQLAFELERLQRVGIGTETIVDEGYPAHLREKLGEDAPTVLFIAGERSLLGISGLGVVGSRDADPGALRWAEEAGRQAAVQRWSTVSGGARGIDQAAMRAAWDAGGVVIAAVAEGVERALRDASMRAAILEERIVVTSPYRPDAPFSVGAAMGRNRLIYGLATATVVVSSAVGEGGTWTGAVEALKHDWGPVLVRDEPGAPAGNRKLMELGGRGVGMDVLQGLPALIVPRAKRTKADKAAQATLFD